LILPALPSHSTVTPSAFETNAPALPEIGTGTADPPHWLITEDVIAGSVTVTTRDAGTTVLPDGTSLVTSESLEMTAFEREPGRGRFANECVYRLRQDGVEVDVVANGVTVAELDRFDMEVRVDVHLDGRPFFERTQHETIPRDLL
jgi:hypothetical protein